MGEDDQPETAASTPNSNNASQNNKAAKDRNCPFCGQAFTSSSLGRHLDLYIKPKNPKPPDGVHDVEEIKKIRGGITRRQPRTSLKSSGDGRSGSTRDNSHTPGYSASNGKQGAQTESTMAARSPVVSPVNAEKRDPGHGGVNQATWQATGVINNLPPRAPSRNDGPPTGQAQRLNEMRRDTVGNRTPRPEHDGDGMWKLQESAELGRAAEMALREVLGSLEAAQKKVESKAIFDEFDFYSLSFPGLCLAILPAPSTLFSPTPFPSPESWTLGPPGQRQYEAMNRFVNERVNEKKKYEVVLDSLVFKHHSHLSGAWEHWQGMSDADRAFAWNLEILRSCTRNQEHNRQLRAELDYSQQRIRHLEAEFDRLSRCQLPREYLLHPPNTIPVSSNIMREVKSTQFRSDVGQTGFDAEALLSRWRSTIKATSRPSRSSQQTGSTANTQTYTEQPRSATIGDDMVMNGSIWNVNGPFPRGQNFTNPGEAQSGMITYETPPNPGAVVEGADEHDGSSNADADGEAEDDGHGVAQHALMRRDDMIAKIGASPYRNSNGKRPLAPPPAGGGRGATKLYKMDKDGGRS